MNHGKALSGAVVVILGILVLFHTLGVYSEGVAKTFTILWPIGLIIAGICLIARMPGIAFILLIFTAVLAVLALTSEFVGEKRLYLQQVEQNPTLDAVEILVSFGAGKLNVAHGDESYFLRNEVRTRASDQPNLELVQQGNVGEITLESIFPDEEWMLTLSPNIPTTFTAYYGAAHADFDFSSIDLRKLELSSGATDTRIKFPLYPTKAVIDTGASSLRLEFPRGTGVRLFIEGGPLGLDLQGFKREDDSYVNEWWRNGGIEVDISAGASNIATSFYEVTE